jgi:hypothetical protein
MMFMRMSRAASKSFWMTTDRDEMPLLIGMEATTTARPANADQPRSWGDQEASASVSLPRNEAPRI